MEQVHARQIPRERERIRELLNEVVEEREIKEWIRETVRSILDRTQELLIDVESEQESIRDNSVLQLRWSNRIYAFARKAHGILDEVAKSVRMLGSGKEELKMLYQVGQAQELVRRVCAMCIELISGESELMVEEV